jgi:hypothetical protein
MNFIVADLTLRQVYEIQAHTSIYWQIEVNVTLRPVTQIF